VDSLQAVLLTQANDTFKVNTLLALGGEVFRSQPDDAVAYSQQAIELSKEIDFKKGWAYALKNMGLAYYVKGNYDEVLHYWKQSLEVFESIEDRLGVSNLLNNLGAVYFNLGDDPKALEYYLESLRVSQELGNQLRIATALTNIGAVYFNNPVNHDKARKYYLQALRISEASGDPAAIGTSIVNLGETYIANGKLDSALYFFERSLAAYDESGANKAYILNNIAKVNSIRGNYTEAITIHQKALEEAANVDGKLEMTQSLNGIGQAYLDLGDKNEKAENYNQAFSYFERALEEARAGGWQHEIELAANGLYRLYKMRGNYPKALELYELYESTKDTLLNEKNINALALLGAEFEYEQEKQQLEYDHQNLINRQKSIQLATAAGLVVALLFIAFMIQYYRLSRKREAEKLEAQQQLLRQDKLASLGQITAGIAHEIKNPLNFVTNFAEGSVEFGEELVVAVDENAGYLPEDQYQLIKDLALDLQQNARIIQENGIRADRVVKRMMEQARAEQGEMRRIDLNRLIDENIYLAYVGYRANIPDFHVELEKNYDPNLPEVEVVPQDIGRVILNIVQNACYALHEKQQLSGNSFQPHIRISTELAGTDVLIRLRDNGPGIPKKIRSKIFKPFFTTKPAGTDNTGLGLSISHDLIVIGHEGDLNVESEPGEFTEFLIRLPLESAAKLVKKDLDLSSIPE
jgi:signal transduction histidine kinase